MRGKNIRKGRQQRNRVRRQSGIRISKCKAKRDQNKKHIEDEKTNRVLDKDGRYNEIRLDDIKK